MALVFKALKSSPQPTNQPSLFPNHIQPSFVKSQNKNIAHSAIGANLTPVVSDNFLYCF
ncbi:MAG: hypothetical protein ACPHY8_04395 [Patescibacteria group bacterium]